MHVRTYFMFKQKYSQARWIKSWVKQVHRQSKVRSFHYIVENRYNQHTLLNCKQYTKIFSKESGFEKITKVQLQGTIVKQYFCNKFVSIFLLARRVISKHLKFVRKNVHENACIKIDMCLCMYKYEPSLKKRLYSLLY